MSGLLSGVRVVELASWTYVPSAGAALADWGADVVKVEDTRGGDPCRGLVVSIQARSHKHTSAEEKLAQFQTQIKAATAHTAS